MKHGWSKPTRYLVLAIVLAAAAGLLLAARALLGSLVIAALVAYVLNPGVTLLTGRARLRRGLAVVLVYLGFLALLIVVPVLFAPVVVRQARLLAAELGNIELQLEELVQSPTSMWGFDLPLDDWLAELQSFTSQTLQPARIFRVIRTASTNFAWVLVILVSTFYLLQDWARLREWLIGLAPEAYQPDVRRLQQEIKDVWRAYLRGQLLVMFIIGVSSGLAAAALGLPGAAVLGLLTGALDIIPSVGPAMAMVVAAAVAWFEGSTYLPWSNAVLTGAVFVAFGLIQAVENLWLRPRIFSQRLRLHPGLVFVAVVGALVLVGALAALIVVPLLGTADVVGRYLRRRVLGQEPWPLEAAEQPR